MSDFLHFTKQKNDSSTSSCVSLLYEKQFVFHFLLLLQLGSNVNPWTIMTKSKMLPGRPILQGCLSELVMCVFSCGTILWHDFCALVQRGPKETKERIIPRFLIIDFNKNKKKIGIMNFIFLEYTHNNTNPPLFEKTKIRGFPCSRFTDISPPPNRKIIILKVLGSGECLFSFGIKISTLPT